MDQLLERSIQMNMVIVQELQNQQKASTEQHKELISQHSELISNVTSQLTALLAAHPSGDATSERLIPRNKLQIKPKQFTGLKENVVTWMVALDEIFQSQQMTDSSEKISTAASLLDGPALQWYVNLRQRHERPDSWDEFKILLKNAFQPADFQEHLRHQLYSLKQKGSLDDYTAEFRNLIGQVERMDDLTQVMLYTAGLVANTGLYVRSKHPATLEVAIREATTYDSIINSHKTLSATANSSVFLESSSRVELNTANMRRQPSRSRDELFRAGLCFRCGQEGHISRNCPARRSQPTLPMLPQTRSGNGQR
jgi:hypothetical protein